MYNRYIPQQPFQPVDHEAGRPQGKNESSPFSGLLSGLFGGHGAERGSEESRGLDRIWKALHLDRLDKGDLLLILLILYLYWDSDNDKELLIILGALLLLGL